MDNEKFYSIGFDIGTDSIGWAVLNPDYSLMKIKHKHAWGAYLFEAGATAVERRAFRSSRTRLERRKERIRNLQMLIGSEVIKQDEGFFIKLKQSFLHNKNEDFVMGRDNYYNLFEGEFSDKEYYQKFPTIYHLRNALANDDCQYDFRLVYLALHHIIKYRGNFLREGEAININAENLTEQILGYFEGLKELSQVDMDIFGGVEHIDAVLSNKSLSKVQKIEQIEAKFSEDKKMKQMAKMLACALLGRKFSTQKLFGLEEALILNESGKETSISFSDADFDEKADFYRDCLGDYSLLLDSLNETYNTLAFKEVLHGQTKISKAMINIYEKHKKDLLVLKRVFKTDKVIYDDFFKNGKGCNYVNYVSTCTKTTKAMEKKCKREDLYAKITKLLEKFQDGDDKFYIVNEMGKDDFLPKLNDVRNSLIPYQMQLEELEQILDNQGKYYPILKENKEKIIKILTFRRPYFVGKMKGKYSWNEQEIDQKLYPWNFEQLVDYDELGEKFILNMTNHCNYFPEEECLPKNSIIYQAYMCLNELNGVVASRSLSKKDNLLSNEMRKEIFLKLMCTKRTVKVKDLLNFLKMNYNIELTKEQILGLSDEEKFVSSMTTLLDFKRMFGDDFSANDIDLYEQIVRHISIFEDKKVRKNGIKNLGIEDQNMIEKLSKLRYSGWGRFSGKFLNGILTSERKTILQTMFDKRINVNEIIFDEKLGIDVQIKQEDVKIDKFNYKKHIEPLYCSPNVKKAIWNVCKIVEEIVKIVGYAPKYIFLENTKDETVKQKTKSKVDYLIDLYNDIDKNEKYFCEECGKRLQGFKRSEDKLIQDKMYLWFTQMGRSMYSGDIIPFDRLLDNDYCEIDHIVPRCYIKDDSFSNRVLVKKMENQNKSGTLALDFAIRSKMSDFWQFLYKKKLISGVKFRNLNKNEYTENDADHFISRQLVETSQTIKETTELLSMRFNECVVRGVKAKMNSLMRQMHIDEGFNEFYKLRNLNDMHHAKDAYLTAVIGQFTSIAYPVWGQDKESLKLKYVLENFVQNEQKFIKLQNARYGLIINAMKDCNLEKFTNNEYFNVLKSMEYNDCLIVRQKNFEANQNFYDMQIVKKNDKLQPIRCIDGHPLDPKLYGGYNKVQAAYYCIVAYNGKKATEFECVGIPVFEAIKIKDKPKETREKFLKDYADKILKKDCTIVKTIYQNQKVVRDGHPCLITSATYMINAVQMCVDTKHNFVLKMLENVQKDRTNGTRNTLNLMERDSEKYSHMMKAFLLEFCDRLDKYYSLYRNNSARIREFVEQKFDDLSMEEKVGFAKNIEKLGNAKSCQLNMKDTIGTCGFGMITGKMKPQELVWIDESMTGLYRKKYKLDVASQ